MQYRIEVSPHRKGVARVNFPGRIVALEARRHVGEVWLVGVSDPERAADGAVAEGAVTVRATSAGDAVWRVAQATVRAVAQLTDTPIDGEIAPAAADNRA